MKRHLLKFAVLIALTVSGCSIDLKTKDLVNEELKYRSLSIIDHYFNLTYVENHAIAFGLFQNLEGNIRMPLVLGLPITVTLLALFVIWKMRRSKFRILLPVFIVLGGAYGNILDRIMHGYVTDFLHLHYFDSYHFYVFNIADLLVNLGFILLLIQHKEFHRSLGNALAKHA